MIDPNKEGAKGTKNDMPPPQPVIINSIPSINIDAFPMIDGPQRANRSRKIALAPGHSPMDWARLKAVQDLRDGVTTLQRYTLDDLALHNKKEDLWMAFSGKVYNITHYKEFHQGGLGQLMRSAGRDGTEMINKIHPWVNIDAVLDKCFIGYLVRKF